MVLEKVLARSFVRRLKEGVSNAVLPSWQPHRNFAHMLKEE
jgi:hypothetical protein